MSKDSGKNEGPGNEFPTYKMQGIAPNGLEGIPAPKPGRPRDRGVHRRVVECTRQLARQGLSYRDISFDAVSREAGVAKTTLYRWWDSKAELIREACFLDQLKCPDTGSLSDDLEDLIRQEIAAQTGFTSRAIFSALIAELISIAEESEVEVPCPYQMERCEMISEIFQNAIARGEWAGPVGVESTYEALFGMIFYPCIGRGKKLGAPSIQRLAAHMLSEARAGV